MKKLKPFSLLGAAQLTVFAILLTPLLFHPSLMFFYTSTKAYLMIALIEILLVLYLWLAHKHTEYAPRFDLVSLLLFLFVSLLGLTSLTGIDPAFSFWASIDRITGLLMWIHLGIAFFVISQLFRTQADWRKLFVVTTSVALFVGAFQVLARAGVHILPSDAGGSTFGNSSFLAGYILFHIFFTAYLAFGDHPKRIKQFGAIAIALLVLTLLLIKTHAAIYAFLGGCVLFLALSAITHKSRSRNNMGYTLLGLLILGFFIVVVLAFQPGSFIQEMFVGHSTGSRFVLWEMAWKGIQERPLLGWGLENFQYVSLEYFNPCLGTEACGNGMWLDRAHNKFLDLLIDSGLIGLLSFLAIHVGVVLTIIKGYRKKWIPPIALTVILTALATYLVQAITSVDSEFVLFLWILTLAFTSAATREQFLAKDLKPGRPLSQIVPWVATIVFPVVFFVFFIQPFRANLAVSGVVKATSHEARMIQLERALNGSPQGEDIRRILVAFKVASSVWKTDSDLVLGVEDTLTQELDLIHTALEETINESPNYLRAYLELALSKQAEGRYFDRNAFQEAIDTLEKAIEQNPQHPDPHWALASILIELGRADEAVVLTKKILDQEPSILKSQLMYMTALLYAGEREQAEAVAEVILTTEGLRPSTAERVQNLLDADLIANAAYILLTFH